MAQETRGTPVPEQPPKTPTVVTDAVAGVLRPEYRSSFTLIAALAALIALFFFGVASIEKFVDGRVELKIAAQKIVTEDHEKRLGKIEEKLGSMTDVLAEIRADVKVMRAQMERK